MKVLRWLRKYLPLVPFVLIVLFCLIHPQLRRWLIVYWVMCGILCSILFLAAFADERRWFYWLACTWRVPSHALQLQKNSYLSQNYLLLMMMFLLIGPLGFTTHRIIPLINKKLAEQAAR